MDEPWGRITTATRGIRINEDIKKDSITLGRSHKCEIRIENTYLWVSSQHFTIYRYHTGSQDSEPESAIKDTSTYGTWLNGMLIGKGNIVTIADGDIIGLRMPKKDGSYRDHNTITLTFRKFSEKDMLKTRRCSAPYVHNDTIKIILSFSKKDILSSTHITHFIIIGF